MAVTGYKAGFSNKMNQINFISTIIINPITINAPSKHVRLHVYNVSMNVRTNKFPHNINLNCSTFSVFGHFFLISCITVSHWKVTGQTSSGGHIVRHSQ